MPQWEHVITFRLFLLLALNSGTQLNASIISSVFGLPTECIHQNQVMPCKLSFSCWLQGGRHAQGCGENRWLFSCCVPDTPEPIVVAPPKPPVVRPLKPAASKIYPKVALLRRRIDTEAHNYECGISRSSQNTLQKRIIGGRLAQFAEYPWQAHIRILEYQCGGVLLSRRFIATAAHCIQQARIRDIIVFLGELDTQNSGTVSEPLPAERHRVIQKIIHPRFQFRITQPDRFDLALLKLSRPAGYKSHILPICLPVGQLDLTGVNGMIAGWGKTEASTGTGTSILRTASVPIISLTECVAWHESKNINVELYNEMLCAGHLDGRMDACLGDSGSPLIVKIKERHFLVGITSAGFGCGVEKQPGIYHNVMKTSKWIQETIKRS
ncbi:serine proteinase stubble [Phlebotomus papatasi]|uniref:serine proteinase stubble n=1 Tax=Phlebotomus papatasi TaxID=29031 RepID=UPI0024841941|nr:serine proteinase stubble [Phlebotomus papatasi]